MDEKEKPAEERYSPENLMRYRTAAAVAENMEKEGLLSPCDKRKIIDVLNKKYGLSSCSIFSV